MPRKPVRQRAQRNQPLLPAVRSYLLTGTSSEDEPGHYEAFILSGSVENVRAIWEEHRDEILSDWTRKNPCARPWAWWTCDAPRWTRKFGAWFDGTLPEPRRRLGGVGDPAFEHLAYVPEFESGLPVSWVTKFDEEYYNGRRRDVNGNIIPTKYKDGDFSGKAINPENPPCFESIAAYLLRHNLLTPFELKHLEKHPELLEPEKVEFEEENNDTE